MSDPVENAAAWRSGVIPDVWQRTITFHPDARGSFGELWRDSWRASQGGSALDAFGPPEMPVRQVNVSRSAPRVLRGLHAHRRQADLWIVLEGRAFVALVDLRPRVRGDGPAVVETVDAAPGTTLYIPAGVAHGFYAPGSLALLYFVTNEYDGSDELGFAWDDGEAAVPWPDPHPILSARDAGAPSLADLLEHFRLSRQ